MHLKERSTCGDSHSLFPDPSHFMNKILVCGAGGFIGGHLIADLRRQGYTRLRAVDRKPLDDWYQRFADVENLSLDLSEKGACERACDGGAEGYNREAGMGGMGVIELNNARCI